VGVPFDFAQGTLSNVEAWGPTRAGGGGAPPATNKADKTHLTIPTSKAATTKCDLSRG